MVTLFQLRGVGIPGKLLFSRKSGIPMLYKLKKRKYMLFSSSMSRKSWARVSGLTFFIISSDPQWMESDRWLYRDNSCYRELGGQIGGGAMRSKPDFDPRSYHPRGLSF